MAYLLSTEALLDFIAKYPDGPVAKWAASVPQQYINISVISVAQAEIAINELAPDDPNRAPLTTNFEFVRAIAQSEDRLRDVDGAAAGRWATIAPLDLRRKAGSELGTDTRMVVATALAHDLTLVVARDLWTDALKGHGLRIVDPFSGS